MKNLATLVAQMAVGRTAEQCRSLARSFREAADQAATDPVGKVYIRDANGRCVPMYTAQSSAALSQLWGRAAEGRP